MSDLYGFGIGELQSVFSRGEARPSDYLEQILSRIEAYNPKLRAFIEVDAEASRAAARLSDVRFQTDDQRPLEGAIIAVKANIAVRGMELNAGADARRGIISEHDAEAVARLRAAGAIIIGTTNMHENALGATTDNPFFGRCINPHGEGLTPGGSSGGSAVAVAAGLCTAALGTDTLGSIRIPAAYCGVFGLKPTLNVVPTSGLVPLCRAYDAIGPIARTLEDISTLSHILFAPDLSTAMRRTRFLQLANDGGVEIDPTIAQAISGILKDTPETPGYIVINPDCARLRTAGFMVSTRELVCDLVELGEERCARLSSEMEFLIDHALNRSIEELEQDEDLLRSAAKTLNAEIGSNGILVTPTVPHTAFTQGDRPPSNQADFTALANIAGLPAISLPIGFDDQGRPFGLQLIGPMGGEVMLIAQARMINDRIKGYAPPAQYWS